MTATFTGTALGRCAKCRTAHTARTDFYGDLRRDCDCGNKVTLRGVWGRETDKKCDGRCTHAISASCDCSCGGKNHGNAWGA